MGQPMLPKWIHEGARCKAKINGATYNAVITKELDYGRFKVKTAVPDYLNGGYRFTDYSKPVSHTNLMRRSTYVAGLDTPTPEEREEFQQQKASH